KEDVPTLSEKQRLILGKWQQLEVRNLITGQNELGPCQVANPTVFEFKTDGKCYASSPGGCFQGTSITPYAISADGSIIVIEDLLYYIETLNNTEFVFTFGSRTNPSYRQKWRKVQ
ncbi:MAG: hypothetical protein RMJ97_11405, partial [Raineya sp.]|nr:hypothetical protein [Raineya sp.]